MKYAVVRLIKEVELNANIPESVLLSLYERIGGRFNKMLQTIRDTMSSKPDNVTFADINKNPTLIGEFGGMVNEAIDYFGDSFVSYLHKKEGLTLYDFKLTGGELATAGSFKLVLLCHTDENFIIDTCGEYILLAPIKHLEDFKEGKEIIKPVFYDCRSIYSYRIIED